MLALVSVLYSLLVGQTLSGSVSYRSLDNVCDSLSKFFNTLNDALPIVAHFESGITDLGLEYPAGTITFNGSRKLENCQAYGFDGSTIYRIKFAASVNISLPNFKYDGEESDTTLSASDVGVEVHYRASETRREVELAPIMTEVRSLGAVSMSRAGGAPEDFSGQAEDLLRPILFYSLDDFLKRDLDFRIRPSSYDPAKAAFAAFKTLFKAFMYSELVRQDQPTPTPQPSPTQADEVVESP